MARRLLSLLNPMDREGSEIDRVEEIEPISLEWRQCARQIVTPLDDAEDGDE